MTGMTTMMQHPRKKMDVPLSVLDLEVNQMVAPPAKPCKTALIWPSMPSVGDTNTTGWPSITTPKA
jgi:hypothetical protein